MPFEGLQDEAVADVDFPITTSADEFPVSAEDESWYLANALTTPPVLMWDSPEFMRLLSEIH